METALALAHLGISAVVIEANAYRPDPRYGKPTSRGLKALLSGHQSLPSEIVPGDAERPDRVPVGNLEGDKHLPEIQNLVDVLAKAAQIYRVVLVDIPSILISVDAEFVARNSDVVVLVVEAESVTKMELKRAAKSLRPGSSRSSARF